MGNNFIWNCIINLFLYLNFYNFYLIKEMGNCIFVKKAKTPIEEYVDKLLQNNNINLSFAPDSVEKKLYVELLTSLFTLIENTLQTIEFKFLNRRITLIMEEIKEEN